MKRYDFEERIIGSFSESVPVQDDHGEWVRHSDVADYDALKAVVDALPTCDQCPTKATHAGSVDGIEYACDEHAVEPDWVPSDELPYAEALRKLERP